VRWPSAWEQRNARCWKNLPSRAAKTVTENTSLCMAMICKAWSRVVCVKVSNKSEYQSQTPSIVTPSGDSIILPSIRRFFKCLFPVRILFCLLHAACLAHILSHNFMIPVTSVNGLNHEDSQWAFALNSDTLTNIHTASFRQRVIPSFTLTESDKLTSTFYLFLNIRRRPKRTPKSKSVGQSVLVSGSHLGPMTRSYYCQTVLDLLMGGLSDEKKFTISAGPR
jgi:hypothetical protein